MVPGASLRSFEVVISSGPVVSAGSVRCDPSDPAFRVPDTVSGYRIVFPRRAVWITPSHARRYVSDPGVVEYYNDGDVYAREELDPRGDRTDWFGVSESVIREIVARYDPVQADAQRPFRHPYGPTDCAAFAAQRFLMRRLSTGEFVEPLEVEETVLAVTDASLSRLYAVSSNRAPVSSHERDIADRANVVLNRTLSTPVSLAAISREAAVSMFHLSRTFRRVTGETLARRRRHLQLLASLEPLLDSRVSIADLARRYDFGSPSHFGAVFHRTFGDSPTAFRTRASRLQRQICDRRAR